jgi:hypothetical protein
MNAEDAEGTAEGAEEWWSIAPSAFANAIVWSRGEGGAWL